MLAKWKDTEVVRRRAEELLGLPAAARSGQPAGSTERGHFQVR